MVLDRCMIAFIIGMVLTIASLHEIVFFNYNEIGSLMFAGGICIMLISFLAIVLFV